MITPPPLPEGYLTTNFTLVELACKCGCGTLPGPGFLTKLQQLRDDFGKPMQITSGARCAAHNMKVASTGPNGPHVVVVWRSSSGQGAVDVLIHGPNAFELVAVAMNLRQWWGFGLKQHGPLHNRFIHIDNIWNSVSVPRPRIWTYEGDV